MPKSNLTKLLYNTINTNFVKNYIEIHF